MAQQDAVIRLLLVEDQLEDAEQLISMSSNIRIVKKYPNRRRGE